VYRLYRSLGYWPKGGGEKAESRGSSFRLWKSSQEQSYRKKERCEARQKKKGEERKKKRKQNATVKSRKTQRQGRELNQHSTFSSPSPSSSPQRASAEGKKRNSEPAWPSFSVTTSCAQKLQYRCLHPSQLPEREIKKTQKTGQRRRKKRGESAGKTKNYKPAGTAFRSLLSFFAYKICRTGKKKVQKTSREKEARRLQRWNSEEERQQRIGGKNWSRLQHWSTSQQAFKHHRCPFVPRSVLFTPRTMHSFCFVFALFKWILIHLNSNVVSLHAFCLVSLRRLCPFAFVSSRVTCVVF